MEKKFIMLVLVGLFCIPIWAGEKDDQNKRATVLEKYWLISNVIKKQECPQELNNGISRIACGDDIIKIKELVLSFKRLSSEESRKVSFTPAMEKQIYGLNQQQLEGLSYLIKNRRYSNEIFTKAQHIKMKMVPPIFAIALGERCVDVTIPSNTVRLLYRIEHLTYIPLWSIGGGIVGAGAFCFNSMFPSISGISSEENDFYESMKFGVCAGALWGAAKFSVDELDRIGYEFPDGRMRMILFEQPSLPKLDKDFLPKLDKDFMKELRDREKQWEKTAQCYR